MVSDVSPDIVERIIRETRLLFVDAWAPWCQPCRALTPILEELDAKYADNPDIRFLKVNTEEYRKFAIDNMIHAIPCVLLYFDGAPAKYETTDQRTGEKKKLNRLIGLRPLEHYEDVIEFFFGQK
ncbi:MAG: thioredoxin family protein [Candidatus Thorarchaeota archaeon SMTZ1-45]|nr:MAG: hypothetical protein AM325_02180 [Candidatus Thorarchaeota archaeon SMTZ1-45]